MPVSERKCAHPGCPCPADPGSEYCSESCRKGASNADLDCPCDHALCRQAQEATQRRDNPKDEVSGSYDPRTAQQDLERPLTDDWGAGDKH
jgi:hypothetical protein